MNEKMILEKSIAAFENETGLHIEFAREKQINGMNSDATIKISGINPPLNFFAEIRKVDRFQILYTLKSRENHADPNLLISPYVTKEIAEKCRALGISFIDTAGNAFIKVPGFYMYVTGRPRLKEAEAVSQYKAITSAGMRVVFSLLTQPELIHATYRKIALQSGIALGTVGGILTDLEQRGFIVTSVSERRRIIAFRRLIEEWTVHYPVELRPRLELMRFSSSVPEWWRKVQLSPDNAVWGGEVAAAKLTGNLKPETITLYVSGKPDEIITQNRLKADEQGNIEILKMFWKPINKMEVNSNYLYTAHPLLVYADLLFFGDSRNREIAQNIYERYIEDIINQR